MNANGGTRRERRGLPKLDDAAPSSRHAVAIFKLCSNSGSCHFEPSPKIASDGAPARSPPGALPLLFAVVRKSADIPEMEVLAISLPHRGYR